MANPQNVFPIPKDVALVDPLTGRIVSPVIKAWHDQQVVQVQNGQAADILNLLETDNPVDVSGLIQNALQNAPDGGYKGELAQQIAAIEAKLTAAQGYQGEENSRIAALEIPWSNGYQGEETQRIANLEAMVAILATGSQNTNPAFGSVYGVGTTVTLTTSPLLVSQLSLGVAGTYLITGAVDFVITGAGDNGFALTGILTVGAIPQTKKISLTGVAGQEATLTQVWNITVAAANTPIYLNAQKAGGTGTSSTVGNNSGLTATFISAA